MNQISTVLNELQDDIIIERTSEIGVLFNEYFY